MSADLNLTLHERELIAIISFELARDGGSLHAIPLKEFAGDKKVDALLQGKKFLSFLEAFPSIFQVNRSNQNVSLLSFEFVVPQNEHQEQIRKQLAAENLEERAIYVLRQLEAKQHRRKAHRRPDEMDEQAGVTLNWLAQKCASRLHQWNRLHRNVEDHFDDQQNSNDCISQFNAFLRERQHIFQMIEGDPTSRWTIAKQEPMSEDNLLELATELFSAAVAGGINLSQLLHHSARLRHLLGGRDLRALTEGHPRIFHEIAACHDENGHICIKKSNMHFSGRLEVDEVAQFSVTASKYSVAMATALFHVVSKRADSNQFLAVDMTAGAGGLTLALAKRFSVVVAIEIEPVRAEMCRTNMISQGVKNVNVVCADAMEYVFTMDSSTPFVLIIDPPWGGLNYRRDCQNIGLGKQWPLAAILASLAQRLLTFCVGLKLPVTFDVDKLIVDANCGAIEGKLIKRSSIKKLGPQLFVVLEIPATITSPCAQL
jgi:RNA cap guanine-N2 methyltransferase